MSRPVERSINDQQIALIREALNEVAFLAVLYERRLIVKGRYQREARLAALKLKGAKAILRSLPPVEAPIAPYGKDAIGA